MLNAMSGAAVWQSIFPITGKRLNIPIMTHPGIEMIGKTVREAVQCGEVHAMSIEKMNKAYPVDATTVIMDLTLEAEAFGCDIDFPENDMPHIKGRIIQEPGEIENLKVPLLDAGRVPEYLKANRVAVANNFGKPVLGGAIGPFSLAGRLYDMSEIMMACYMHPDEIHALLEKCAEFILSYCRELKNLGCAGVVIAEPAAGLLSNDDCLAFSSRYVKQIVNQLQDERFIVVLHNCGNSGHCTGAMLQTGAGALHFGNAIDMVATLEACPANVLVMGNVDPVGIMKQQQPEQIKCFVTDLLERTVAYPNFILSTGCDLPPHVPFKNIDAYFEALATFNQA
jgi:uroporphyrinogen decarboxylase